MDKQVGKIEIPSYIDNDPVQFMHAFQDKRDQELAGFIAATMGWGRRDIVIAKTEDFFRRMNNRPYDFILNFSESDAEKYEGFKHRTFKPVDMYWITKSLQSILKQYQSFEDFWAFCYQKADKADRELVAVFHEEFFSFYPEMPRRVRKHVSNPEKGSAAKRLYMYLRWCIRKGSPVDAGIMNFMDASELKIPLDVHVARQARKLGLLSRRQNDWKTVLELTEKMKLLDPRDPVKYDYALFGIGVNQTSLPSELMVNKNVR